jgi:hypothetical protein
MPLAGIQSAAFPDSGQNRAGMTDGEIFLFFVASIESKLKAQWYTQPAFSFQLRDVFGLRVRPALVCSAACSSVKPTALSRFTFSNVSKVIVAILKASTYAVSGTNGCAAPVPAYRLGFLIDFNASASARSLSLPDARLLEMMSSIDGIRTSIPSMSMAMDLSYVSSN